MNCRRTWWGGIGGLGRRSLVVISARSCRQAVVSQVLRKYTTIISDEEEELIVVSRLQFTTNSQGQADWNTSQSLRCKTLSLFKASPPELKNWDLQLL